MALGRLGNGGKIAGASAILLFVFMFLDWFGTTTSDRSFGLFSVGRNAWEALDYLPIVLVITIVVALGTVAMRLTGAAERLRVPAGAAVAILGVVSALSILYRIVDPPTFGLVDNPFFPTTIEGTVQFPVFLALAASAGIAFGGYLAMREGPTVASSALAA